ncbi:hypothetical protein SACS_0170 [Parasaccharibacter apium]|uniref:Uncharacterized protein n=1 Tax=Parasaccharibacter apium TaxID=1510841 RepID=A0A7U7G4C5_9PROT|nr:hypothetical protein SACS_0170 [Parasaccharibacter apium]
MTAPQLPEAEQPARQKKAPPAMGAEGLPAVASGAMMPPA